VPYANNSVAHWSRVNADSFFVNRNDLYCPITQCFLREKDCRTNYTGGVYVDQKAPFGIFAHTDFPVGFIEPLCLICQNQDETRAVVFDFNQLSCKETGNCGEIYNVTLNDTKGSCSGKLGHIANPTSIVIPFNPTNNM
jgi:hypothetical protein